MRRLSHFALAAGVAVVCAAAGCDPDVSVQVVDTSAECSGLVPHPPHSHVSNGYDIPSASTCLNGISDGTGHLATGERDPATQIINYHAMTSAGTAIAQFSDTNLEPLLAQPSGYHSVTSSTDGSTVAQETFSNSGTMTATTPLSVSTFFDNLWDLSANPAGGSLAVFRRVDNFHNHFFVLTAQRFNPDGSAVSSPTIIKTGPGGDEPLWLTGGVSALGQSLVTFDFQAHLHALWLDASGTALGAEIAGDPMSPSHPVLSPLLDGSMVFQNGGVWKLQFPNVGTTVVPAPAWLAADANTKLETVRGRKAYALLPFGGASAKPCEQRVEIRAPSGRLCGTLTFKYGTGACITKDIDVGWDGTVIQQSPVETCSGSTCTCSHRWWPRLLN
jgi:hypothetical protein